MKYTCSYYNHCFDNEYECIYCTNRHVRKNKKYCCNAINAIMENVVFNKMVN